MVPDPASSRVLILDAVDSLPTLMIADLAAAAADRPRQAPVRNQVVSREQQAELVEPVTVMFPASQLGTLVTAETDSPAPQQQSLFHANPWTAPRL